MSDRAIFTVVFGAIMLLAMTPQATIMYFDYSSDREEISGNEYGNIQYRLEERPYRKKAMAAFKLAIADKRITRSEAEEIDTADDQDYQDVAKSQLLSNLNI